MVGREASNGFKGFILFLIFFFTWLFTRVSYYSVALLVFFALWGVVCGGSVRIYGGGPAQLDFCVFTCCRRVKSAGHIDLNVLLEKIKLQQTHEEVNPTYVFH